MSLSDGYGSGGNSRENRKPCNIDSGRSREGVAAEQDNIYAAAGPDKRYINIYKSINMAAGFVCG